MSSARWQLISLLILVGVEGQGGTCQVGLWEASSLAALGAFQASCLRAVVGSPWEAPGVACLGEASEDLEDILVDPQQRQLRE